MVSKTSSSEVFHFAPLKQIPSYLAFPQKDSFPKHVTTRVDLKPCGTLSKVFMSHSAVSASQQKANLVSAALGCVAGYAHSQVLTFQTSLLGELNHVGSLQPTLSSRWGLLECKVALHVL